MHPSTHLPTHPLIHTQFVYYWIFYLQKLTYCYFIALKKWSQEVLKTNFKYGNMPNMVGSSHGCVTTWLCHRMVVSPHGCVTKWLYHHMVMSPHGCVTTLLSPHGCVTKWLCHLMVVSSQQTEEQMRLLRRQRQLEDDLNQQYLDMSLHETVFKLVLQNKPRQAENMRKEFKVPERR